LHILVSNKNGQTSINIHLVKIHSTNETPDRPGYSRSVHDPGNIPIARSTGKLENLIFDKIK
jgi:hypothetical protein